MKKKSLINKLNLLLLFIIAIIIIVIIVYLNFIKTNIIEKYEEKNIPIYVISLKKRKDRREHIIKEFNKFNIKNWKFFDAYERTNEEMKKYPGKKKGKIGVTTSHILVWKKCIELNEPIFIFEDDIYLENFNYKDINILLNNKNLWDIVWFGHCFEDGNKKELKRIEILKNFYKSYLPRCRHAYLLSPKGAEILLKNINFETNGDEQMAKLINNNNIKSLSQYPPTVYQSWQKDYEKNFGSDSIIEKFVSFIKK